MKTSDSTKAEHEVLAVRPSSLRRPLNAPTYPGPATSHRTRLDAFWTAACEASAACCEQRHLALPRERLMSEARTRREARDVLQRNAPSFERGTVSAAIALRSIRFSARARSGTSYCSPPRCNVVT
jgi:hypothetical protein